MFGVCFWYALLCVLSKSAIILSRRKAGCFNCLPDFLLLLMFCGFSSRCPGLICDCGISYLYPPTLLSIDPTYMAFALSTFIFKFQMGKKCFLSFKRSF